MRAFRVEQGALLEEGGVGRAARVALPPCPHDDAAGLDATDYPWLKEADSQALQSSLRHLDRAYLPKGGWVMR